MFCNKKGVSLPLNTVIVAIIVLLVLIIMVYLLLSQSKNFTTGTNCFNKGGTCIKASEQCESLISGNKLCGDDINNPQICCKIG